MAAAEDEKLRAEIQGLFSAFEKKHNSDPSLLDGFFHKDMAVFAGEETTLFGDKATVDYCKNFPYYKTNLKVTHVERLSPKHALCELFEDVEDKDGNNIDKLKCHSLFVQNEAGKWQELSIHLTTCIPKKDGSRDASKPSAKDNRPARGKPVGDEQASLWAELQSVMDAITSDWNNEPSKTANYWTVDGRMYPTGQPLRIGKEEVAPANSTVRKEGCILENYYLTFAERLSEKFARARTNFDLTHEKTGEVVYGRTMHIFKSVDGAWLYHVASW